LQAPSDDAGRGGQTSPLRRCRSGPLVPMTLSRFRDVASDECTLAITRQRGAFPHVRDEPFPVAHFDADYAVPLQQLLGACSRLMIVAALNVVTHRELTRSAEQPKMIDRHCVLSPNDRTACFVLRVAFAQDRTIALRKFNL